MPPFFFWCTLLTPTPNPTPPPHPSLLGLIFHFVQLSRIRAEAASLTLAKWWSSRGEIILIDWTSYTFWKWESRREAFPVKCPMSPGWKCLMNFAHLTDVMPSFPLRHQSGCPSCIKLWYECSTNPGRLKAALSSFLHTTRRWQRRCVSRGKSSSQSQVTFKEPRQWPWSDQDPCRPLRISVDTLWQQFSFSTDLEKRTEKIRCEFKKKLKKIALPLLCIFDDQLDSCRWEAEQGD